MEILGKAALLWCNTPNLPKLEVGLVFRQVILTPRTPSSFLNFGEICNEKNSDCSGYIGSHRFFRSIHRDTSR
jgi:hypothetical protein